MGVDLIIGLDVGTTAAKATIFGVDARIHATASREYPLLGPRPGWHVQEPDAVAAGVLEALFESVAQVDPADVQGISISTAMHGLLGLDADRRPLTELITWADSRASAQASRLNDNHATGARLHRTSGTPSHPMSPLLKLMWFGDNEPDLLHGAANWVGLKDWVLYVLTDQVVTELSTASGSGLIDMTERDYNPEAVELSGVRRSQLPPILETTDILRLSPDAARRIGLRSGTPVVVGAGDGPLGNLGTGAMTPGLAGLSIGTSGALRMVVKQPAVAAGLFCYALTRDIWVTGGAISNGGMVQRWLTQTFAPDTDDAEACLRAETVPAGSDGLVMIPYLVSERASLWDSEIRGAFLHVRQPHTPAHFIRAGIEGVSLQLWTILKRLRTIARVEQIRATGGVFRSNLWREVAAGILNRPLVVTGAAEGSGLGAAILGAKALGIVASLSEGYDLLRAETIDEFVDVPAADRQKYTEMRESLQGLLESYGRLGVEFR